MAFFNSMFQVGNEPNLMVRAWQKQLRSEARTAERQICDIRREEVKVQAAVKEAARRGDARSVKMLAREIVNSRKAAGRIYQNIAHMNSVCMMLGEQVATLRGVPCAARDGEHAQGQVPGGERGGSWVAGVATLVGC